MPKISVLTPSARPEGLALVDKALKRQTFPRGDYEWIVGSPFEPGVGDVWVKDRPKVEGEYWTIYSTYNDMCREAKGELIVSIQDFTSFTPDALSKFWEHYSNNHKTVVSGVGNKYEDDTWVVETWRDPRIRKDNGSFYESLPQDTEFNFCALPREAIYRVGGFDEEWGNKYSSVCGLDVVMRLEILGGYRFFLDQTNISYSTEHGRMGGWDERSPFGGAWQNRLMEYRGNPVLGYL